ncbi:hypothetical protein [Actinotalea sp. K2]|uniref:hypothetical protein n=1 Tax=Actinotalea sp. K2 TaxID=2939438 RepID=UPI002017F6D6|nr:hypothetical protein [Actinotalea sp. K2]MCL3859775.1 hypothetical protein [Actinotalea sp. K2]
MTTSLPPSSSSDASAQVQAQVDAAEAELRRLGLDAVRVQPHGELARLEVPIADITTVSAQPLRLEVLRAVRSAGFALVAIDLVGIESSSRTRPLDSTPAPGVPTPPAA